MTKTHQRTLTATATFSLAILLGGCQIFSPGGMATASARAERTASMADFGSEQLAEGRKALQDGKTAAAIDAFMMARAFPEQAPAALNGLAVAYSRIGRPDLAERFFQGAVALAPSEDRYRANLALFYSSNGIPRQAEPAMALAAIAPPKTVQPQGEAQPVAIAAAAVAPAVRRLGAGITVQSAPTRLQRVSRGVVAIRDRAQPTLAAAGSGRRAVIEVGAGGAQSYPVRITLGQPVPAKRQPSQAYPIRIPLDD